MDMVGFAQAPFDALRAELEKVTDANSRAAWERLAGLLAKGSDNESKPGD